MVDKCRAKVAELAQLLDSVKEDWWWSSSINIDTLDQADWSKCVLGQNWGSFTSGMDAIFGKRRPEGSTVGFGGGHYNHNGRVWSADEETEAWKEQIQVRRETWPVAVDESASGTTEQGQVLASTPAEPHLWVVNQSEYSKILLSDGRYVIVPSEWLDTATVSAISSGRKVVEWNFEWESRS